MCSPLVGDDHKIIKQSGGRSLDRFFRAWVNEVSIFRKLNKCQEKYGLIFSPKLYDSWTCKKGSKVYFYILMERFDGDLTSLYDGLEGRNQSISMALNLMDSYLAIIHRSCRICLNDIKLQNILYKKVGTNDYILVFADFGIATKDSDEDCIKMDRENFRKVKENFNGSYV